MTNETESILTDAEKEQAVKAARRNDLRLLLGVLFVIYGVIVTLVGLFDTTSADLEMAAGIHINLWAGIVMLIVGLAFLAWDKLRPLPAEDIIASAEESARQAAQTHEGGVNH